MAVFVQIGIAALPLTLYDGWGFMVTALSGNLLDTITCTLKVQTSLI